MKSSVFKINFVGALLTIVRKIAYAKFVVRFFILMSIILMLIVGTGCEMEKDWNVDFLAFPPKLSITAILDYENGMFDISLMEGRSLADYARLVEINKENIRDGEIRLFEDDALILSIQGPFDMTYYRGDYALQYQNRKNGYRSILTGMNLNPGSVYRLEAEVEGYPLAISAATMPVAPEFSANMDTSVQSIRNNVREIYSLDYGKQDVTRNKTLPDKYWPVSVRITDTDPNVINYFALDIHKMEYTFTGNTFTGGINNNWKIGSSDATTLLDVNTEELQFGGDPIDLYLFSMLLTNDIVHSSENAARIFYTPVAEIQNDPKDDDSHPEDDPNFEKITTQHSLSLRVTHIPPDVFRCYRSLMQNATGWFTEPVPVVSNIENGFGVFSVLNSYRVNLLEWETYEWLEIEKEE